MSKLEETIKAITSPDKDAEDKARKRQDSLTKPPGSLGRLEELAVKVAAITGQERPVIKDKAIIVMAADHGVTQEGVSAYPAEVTPQMVLNFLGGGAAINVLARHAGIEVVVVDIGVKGELAPNTALVNKRIAPGTDNMAVGPAMSREAAVKAIETGIEVFESQAEKGLDIVGTGDMGIGNTTASSAIAAAITKASVADVVGRGTGIDDEGLARKREVVKQAIAVNKPDAKDGLDVLAKVGGYELGGLAGVILAGAARKIPVVIDGFISGAAALIAATLEPQVKDYLIAAHCSVEPGHRLVLAHLGLKPLLEFEMRLGEGTGGALAMSIVEASTKVLNEMATFEEAGVADKE